MSIKFRIIFSKHIFTLIRRKIGPLKFLLLIYEVRSTKIDLWSIKMYSKILSQIITIANETPTDVCPAHRIHVAAYCWILSRRCVLHKEIDLACGVDALKYSMTWHRALSRSRIIPRESYPGRFLSYCLVKIVQIVTVQVCIDIHSSKDPSWSKKMSTSSCLQKIML